MSTIFLIIDNWYEIKILMYFILHGITKHTIYHMYNMMYEHIINKDIYKNFQRYILYINIICI